MTPSEEAFAQQQTKRLANAATAASNAVAASTSAPTSATVAGGASAGGKLLRSGGSHGALSGSSSSSSSSTSSLHPFSGAGGSPLMRSGSPANAATVMRTLSSSSSVLSSPVLITNMENTQLLVPELWLHIFSYLSPRTLACTCASVCRYWASLALESAKDREFAQHETFMLSQPRLFLNTAMYCRMIDAHLASSSQPLVITADSGGGKSSLLVQWIRRYHLMKQPEALVLYHFVGTPSHSTDYLNILHRFMIELKRECRIHDDVPSTLTNVQKKFPAWLQEAANKQKLIIIIDGLNQIDDKHDSHSLNWIPERFPPNVHLIVSTMRGRCLDVCVNKRRWRSIELPPLNERQKAWIIDRTLTDRQMRLSTAQKERLIRAQQTRNPLFLNVLLEYVQSFGNRETVDENIRFYLQAEDALHLYVKIIERLELAFPLNLVRNVLVLLFVARSGLTESELQEILTIDEATWVELYNAIAPSLVLRFGLFSFSNDRFRQAVARKYFSRPDSVRMATRQLASYFQQKLLEGNVTYRVVDELPWLLERAGDREELKNCITNIKLFDKLFLKERKYELFRYWVSAESDSAEIARLYSLKLDEFQRTNQGSLKEVARLAHKIGEYIRDGGHYNEAITFFLKALDIKNAEYGEEAIESATTLNELGRLYFRLGRNEETLNIWKRALEIRDAAKGGREDHDIAISLNNLALIYEKMGRWQEAEPTYKRALEIYRRVSGPDHPDVGITLHNLGLLYSQHNSRLDEAESMYMQAIAIKEKYYGRQHNETAMSLNNLGLVYAKKNQHEKAIEMYRRAIEIRESIFGPDHPDCGLFLFNLGVCLGKMSLFEQAKPCLFRALRIRKRVYGNWHQSTQVVRSWIQYYGWAEQEEDAVIGLTQSL